MCLSLVTFVYKGLEKGFYSRLFASADVPHLVDGELLVELPSLGYRAGVGLVHVAMLGAEETVVHGSVGAYVVSLHFGLPAFQNGDASAEGFLLGSACEIHFLAPRTRMDGEVAIGEKGGGGVDFHIIGKNLLFHFFYSFFKNRGILFGNDILLDIICHSDDRREEESR